MTNRRKFLAASLALSGVGLLASRGARPAEDFRFGKNPFTLGIASGYPTSDGMVLWTRLALEPLAPDGGLPPEVLPVKWEVATDDRMRNVIQHGTAYATPEWAHSIHVEPSGLDPGREYWYRFESGGERSPIGRTRTAPEKGTPLDKLKLGLVCCQHYEQGY